ncbi:MAG: hypothetical protein PHF00_11420 [Elusimicrobia bacterium]|nr:hypothetical protein [Elusimicrobiota bacterium]
MNKTPKDLFHALALGLAGGAAGAVLGHVLVILCLRAGGELWLKGPYGPGQFFGISCYLGVLYGAVALALSRRPVPCLLGFFGNFLGIALPMALLTHLPQPMNAFMGLLARAPGLAYRLMLWTRVPDPVGMAWTVAVVAVYLAANWGTTLALGAVLCPGRRWRGAAGAAAGSVAAYILLSAALALIPAQAQGRWNPGGFIPAPVDLLTGLLTGAGLGAGLYLLAWKRPAIPDGGAHA